MRVLIIDDENKSRESLRMMISNYCEDVKVVDMAANADEAIAKIRLHDPDLLLLDISMPGGSGLDLLKKIPDPSFGVIFVTAYNEYAIQAIRAHAIDYLLKPVSIAELKEALERARQKLGERQPAVSIQKVMEALGSKVNAQPGKLAIPVSDGLSFVPLEEIIALEAEGNYTHILLLNEHKILSTKHLKEYEKLLPESGFFRIHHSHIINLSYIKHYHRGDGGSVTMSNGMGFIVSKRRKKDFLDRFQA